MKPVAMLQHGSKIGAGHLGTELAIAGVPVISVPLYAGAALPTIDDLSGVVALGGVMGAYEESKYPYLAYEKAFLREAVAADTPVLGICLGCQLLADALGGRAYLAPSPEVGILGVRTTKAGAADPVGSQLDGPVLVLHQDTWDLPPGAELLAETDAFPQAFRLGSATGIQPHPEASPAILADWMDGGGLAWLTERGHDGRQLMEQFEANAAASRDVASRIFSAWAEGLKP